MDDILITSTLYRLAYALVAVIMLLALLRWFDKSLGINFKKDVWDKMADAPLALAQYHGLRLIAIAILVGLMLAGCSSAQASPTFPSTYDSQIKTAAAKWLPGVPWRLWKAQLYQESRLDPDARSPAGAEGLAQFMPATWLEITRAMGTATVDRRLAAPSIEAGAYYMARLRRNWSSERPEWDRHSLAMASYNAGIGHILAAQRECGGAILYEPIMACLPAITGRHAVETLGYAPRIWRWFGMMESRA